MDYAQFRDRVRERVEEAVGDEPPVTFDAATGVWRRGKLRVTLVLAGDGETALASRTAADLFRVPNTLGVRHDVTEAGVSECAGSIVGWLNNPSLYS
jgi:hypothetical protein